MRTYGRLYDQAGNAIWVTVTTDPEGYDGYVWATTLIQCLRLNQGESPFYANYGIPAQQSVIQQVFPDYYVAQTQQQFAPYFAALTVAKLSSPTPTYRINITFAQGMKLQQDIIGVTGFFTLDESTLDGGAVLA